VCAAPQPGPTRGPSGYPPHGKLPGPLPRRRLHGLDRSIGAPPFLPALPLLSSRSSPLGLSPKSGFLAASERGGRRRGAVGAATRLPEIRTGELPLSPGFHMASAARARWRPPSQLEPELSGTFLWPADDGLALLVSLGTGYCKC
jgi:hypothetical protein